MRRRRSLAASVSLAALIAPFAGVAKAQSIEGERQQSVDIDPINIYEIADTDPPQISGEFRTVLNPGGPALAEATVSCAEFTSCSNPGAVWQTALGSNSARNLIAIDGTQTIGATAQAIGSQATAIAEIERGLRQHASAPNSASNGLNVQGTLSIVL